jgi:hypothetical protein
VLRMSVDHVLEAEVVLPVYDVRFCSLCHLAADITSGLFRDGLALYIGVKKRMKPGSQYIHAVRVACQGPV